MKEAEIREYRAEDGEYITRNLLHEDAREILLWSGIDPADAVRISVETSTAVFTGVAADGTPTTVFGAKRTSLLSDEAVIWSLSAEEVKKHPIDFVRMLKKGLTTVMDAVDCDTFYNYLDTERTDTKRWLEWLGFRFDFESVMGARGGLFQKFLIKKGGVK